MVLGDFTTESTQYGKQEVTVKAKEGADLAEQLKKSSKAYPGNYYRAGDFGYGTGRTGGIHTSRSEH